MIKINVKKWLLEKQKQIQEEYYNLIGKENCDAYGGGIWITVMCTNCKHDFKTPAWIQETKDGKCQKCGTLFYKKSRRYKKLHKEEIKNGLVQ